MTKPIARVFFYPDWEVVYDQLVAMHEGRIVARGYSAPSLKKKLGKAWHVVCPCPIERFVGAVRE